MVTDALPAAEVGDKLLILGVAAATAEALLATSAQPFEPACVIGAVVAVALPCTQYSVPSDWPVITFDPRVKFVPAEND